MAFSMEFRSTGPSIEVKVKPWAETTIKPDISWTQDANGCFHACDRGPAADEYSARVSVFGTKVELQALNAWIEEYGTRIFSIGPADFQPFGPSIDHSDEIEVMISEKRRLKRTFFSPGSGVEEIGLVLEAVKPPKKFTGTPTIASLLIGHTFEADSDFDVEAYRFQDGEGVMIDAGARPGRFVAAFSQTTNDARDIIRDLLENKRGPFAFPSLGVERPWGATRDAGNCYCDEIGVRKMGLDRWTLNLSLVPAP